MIFVYKTPRRRCALQQAAGRGEGRGVITTLSGGEWRGRIPNKLNLPPTPSPEQPSLFSLCAAFFGWRSVSMLRLVLSDTRRAQRGAEVETDGKTGRGPVVG